MSAHCGHDHSISATGPAARRALWAALVINATMVIVELSAGVLGGSVGLQADAADFFTAEFMMADVAKRGLQIG